MLTKPGRKVGKYREKKHSQLFVHWDSLVLPSSRASDWNSTAEHSRSWELTWALFKYTQQRPVMSMELGYKENEKGTEGTQTN